MSYKIHILHVLNYPVLECVEYKMWLWLTLMCKLFMIITVTHFHLYPVKKLQILHYQAKMTYLFRRGKDSRNSLRFLGIIEILILFLTCIIGTDIFILYRFCLLTGLFINRISQLMNIPVGPSTRFMQIEIRHFVLVG